MRIQQLKEILQLNKSVFPQLQQLKKGQIIQGKVIKIYPQDKAQIQLGGLKLIAQLQAPLTAGLHYHFQIMQADEIFNLKVLGNQTHETAAAGAKHLLNQLSFKPSAHQVAFVQQLMEEQVPFNRQQLQQAFQFMAAHKNKQDLIPIIKEMVLHELPINEQTFQALHVQKNNQLVAQLQKLSHMLSQHMENSPLQQLLSDLLEPSAENVVKSQQQIYKLLVGKNKQLLPLIQTLGGDNNITSLQTLKKLEHYIHHHQETMQHANQILKKWESKLLLAAANQFTLSEAEVSQLKRDTIATFPTLISDKNAQTIDFGRLLVQLRSLQKPQTYQQLERFITLSQTYVLAEPKKQWLELVRQHLQFSGISHEYKLAKDETPPVTLKSQLILALQQTDGALKERIQQVLHHLNGVQISSVQDSQNGFLQAYIQIPAIKLGLPNDMELKFEGKKLRTGKLDPDHCRIVFYLELTNMKETVVDMHVQNRNVSITVFNDHKALRSLSMKLQPLLRKGLREMNYHLSSISFLTLHEEEKKKSITSSNAQVYQGVDFRI
ncbi:hypothetical protein [Virgibacillus pantothenticus]|uniref:hypothetical protein n=1 Tax=Virgibacillus pantothenticus TaxID=1473 RepID=UPI000986F177|nr:hypothetical protein [Virgibacillus pantothenticus]